MHPIRRPLAPVDNFNDGVRHFLSRRAAEMTGFGLVGLAGLISIALMSWSVEDPSLSHATPGLVRNWLGYLGAVIADLLMQMLGLSVVACLLPISLWGIRLMRQRQLEGIPLRLALFILGTGGAAAMASSFPQTARWPMPTGLGGVIGDALLHTARTMTGIVSGPWLAILGGAFGLVALVALSAATATPDRKPRTATSPAFEPRRADPAGDAEEAMEDEPGWGLISLGMLAHAGMSLKSTFSRRFGAEKRKSSSPGARREPESQALRAPALVHSLERIKAPRVFEENAAPWPQDENHAPRVAPPAVPPKPGKRLAREAQPSFLDPQDYEFPSLLYLSEPKKLQNPTVSPEALEQNATMLESTLEDFGVRGEIINVRPGPVVTLYELEPAPGTKSSRVISLADDIARSMSAVSARVAVVQGRNAIGIELPNTKRETVYLRELLASHDFESTKHKLSLCLGKTIGGEPVIADLAKMPHLLVAGTTGSGKSVAINTMILSLLYRLTPEQCRLIMVDPKMLELSVYDGIPHLLSPVVTDPKKAVIALKWAVREMEERYKKMSKLGVRNIDGFNARVVEAASRGEIITRTVQTGFDRETGEAIYEDQAMDLKALPYIVVIVDEMADLMMVAGKEIEGAIQRLAQMARAAGIHIIMATQRPSVDVITGTIKANFPTRISFQVTSKIDSRTILGEMGAEQLLGQGDMLYMAGGGRITRVHGPFVSDDEVEKVVAHLKRQGRPAYLDAVTSEMAEDEIQEQAEDSPVFDAGNFGEPGGDLYDQAVALVLRDKKASTSYIQRRLTIGYNRAASLMERMEKEGIVGSPNHAGKREILVEPSSRGHGGQGYNEQGDGAYDEDYED
jgi:DNA segregation ATPase FtsK/SpoIIIE, S-DNA-T family